MKKIFLILTLALVALAGCKKDPAPGQEPGTEQEPGTGQDTPTTIVFKTSKAVGETITLGFRRSEMQNISMDGAKPESGLPAGDWGIYTCKLSSQTVTIKGDITLFDCKNSGITDIALTKDLRLYDFNCSGNELTSLDVSGLTELVYFACSSNRLTSLNIEGCDKLCYVECYSNSIKGEAMTDIVNDLPKLDTPGAGRLVVTAEGCGNVITAANVATAKGKNWDVVDDKYHEFEGHIAVTGVSLDTEGVEINTKATTTVKALIEPANATNKNVTWTIGNPEIATVNDGVVTGVAEGETTLTVTTVDGGFTASIPVKVIDSSGSGSGGEDEVTIPYVTFTADAGQTLVYDNPDLQYSIDGTTFQALPAHRPIRFGVNTKLYLRGVENWDGTSYRIPNSSESVPARISFGNDNVPVACTGDIRTLIDYQTYKTVDTGKARFTSLFEDCIELTSAPALPATTTLANYCYSSMFKGCTSLVNAPALPATTLSHWCYMNMFEGCTSLVNAPALPATTLTGFCYSGMFKYCTSLVNAPALEATTLNVCCYMNMFEGCTSLVKAPALKATFLEQQCYGKMFYGCTSLKEITMLAIDISANWCLDDWVDGVAATGTFTKAAAMTLLPNGIHGIPAGWTVVNQ